MVPRLAGDHPAVRPRQRTQPCEASADSPEAEAATSRAASGAASDMPSAASDRGASTKGIENMRTFWSRGRALSHGRARRSSPRGVTARDEPSDVLAMQAARVLDRVTDELRLPLEFQLALDVQPVGFHGAHR
ncbi:hypothetical protein Ddc_24326 [Ditylenchus destructor]|nr:hypothetical protein Ddc_24326 [Ditylenchus destructor]